MLIEETRFNLSIPFLLQLTRYFVDSLPTEPIDTGVVNEAYEGHAENSGDKKKVLRRLSTQNITDLSEQPGIKFIINELID